MKKYILLVSAAISLAACNSEDNYIDEPVAAQISATIGQSVVARATNEQWAGGDEIGITMGNLYTNRKYTTVSGNGVFTGTPMYFRNKQDKLTVSAYYPYTGAEGASAPIVEASTASGRQTSAEQPKFDFLYASLDNVTGAAPNINFAFKHQMSKLTLVFVNGNDGTDVSKITSCEISGFFLRGTFNPVTGECDELNSIPASTLNITPTVQNGVAIPPIILFPQAVKKVTMKIHDSEQQDYACELNIGDDGLVSGNNGKFTITVKKTSLSVNSSIVNWKTSELESGASSED